MVRSTAPRRVAVLGTVWFEGSHADVIIPKIVEGWTLDGVAHEVDLEVVAVYLEQIGCVQGQDLGIDFLERKGILRALSIGEALGAGAPGINVDGVLIIGEHGDYELNEHAQQLYPRRRFFDAAMAAMVAADRFVPIFNDKGLSYSARDANDIVETATRLGIELGAGSTIPLAWRIPQGADLPYGSAIEAAVLVGWGPRERYGFHCLEGLQAHVERRAGGESGVRSVRGLSPEESKDALRDGRIDAQLLEEAMARLDLSPEERARALDSVVGAIEIDYRDGLRAVVVICEDEVRQFAVACRDGDGVFSCQMWLQNDPHGHFTFLVRQFEHLVLSGHAAIPIGRAQLATGILDAAMRSWSSAEGVATPELGITYAAPRSVEGTAISLPLPQGWTKLG